MYQGKKIIQPPFLKKGDKVALVAPAYWVAEEAILMAADVLREWELEPRSEERRVGKECRL